jgi:hypothetical protein
VLLEITKPGYVVINWFQLRVTLPKNAEAEPLTLLLCKESEREEWARRFYRLKSLDAIEATYQRKIKDLEATNQQTAAAMAKLKECNGSRSFPEFSPRNFRFFLTFLAAFGPTHRVGTAG